MKRIILTGLCAGMTALVFSSYKIGPFQGGAGNRTGSVAATAGCNANGCHVPTSSTVNMTIQVIEDGTNTVTTYIPGKTYRVVVGAFVTGTYARFGFQSCVTKSSDSVTQAGTLSAGSRADISVRSAATPDVVEHNTPLAGLVALGNTVDSVSFLWTAPYPGVGPVKIFAALNAVNNDGSQSGDVSAYMATELTQSTVGVSNQQLQQLAIYPNPAASLLTVKPGVHAASCRLSVWDMGGKLVISETAVLSGGETSVNTGGLKPGHYFIITEAAGKRYGASFTKQ